MGAVTKRASCHPHREEAAKGLCWKCYQDGAEIQNKAFWEEHTATLRDFVSTKPRSWEEIRKFCRERGLDSSNAVAYLESIGVLTTGVFAR